MNHDDTRDLLIQIDAYVEELFAPPDPVLEAALRRSREAGLPEINVSPNEGKLLQLLAETAGARRILERSGRSAVTAPYIWPAPCPRTDRWSPWSWTSGTPGSPARTSGRPVSGIGSRCGLGMRRRCSPGWSRSGEGPFDLTFIDADKGGYPAYLEWTLRILVDNAIRGGSVLDPGDESARVTRDFNEALARDPRFSALVLPLIREGIDGIAIARVLVD